MEYKIKPIKVNADKGETFPDIKDRVIEMRGQVVEITLSGIEQTNAQREKRIKELNGQKEISQAKVENIEKHHEFLKALDEQQQYTTWMYYENRAIIEKCKEEIAKLESWIAADNKEIEEIKKQIPELNVSEVVKEAENIINGK